MNDLIQNQIRDLLFLALEHEITQEQIYTLNHLIKNNPERIRYAVRYLQVNSILKLSHTVANLRDAGAPETADTDLFTDCLIQMANYEKNAPELKLPEEKLPRELVRKVVYPPREKRKLSIFSKVFLVMNAAAILFIVLFLKFAPAKPVEVATLSDSLNAKWADSDASMRKGARLVDSREKLMLREGLAELLFDNQARITLEGPAEFQILADDRIGLTYGKVYTTVPPAAVGFSVYTPSARIIDLGTEFGVQTDFDGNTQLSVLKGKTLLVAGETSTIKTEVVAGTAKKIHGDTGEISDISCRSDYFVRIIGSESNCIWRGNNLSLASLTAGHDGFQEVGSLISLDPVRGEYVISTEDVYVKTNKAYNLVPDVKFIDGVFVPDGESGPVQISSLGHTFDCPDTSGIFTHKISVYKGSIENQHKTIPPAIVNGREVVNEPILMLHSNIGITFDLQAIRESLPQLNLKSLKGTGMPMGEVKYPDLDFWVLVDGQIKYERKIAVNDTDRSPVPFNVELRPKDRFLTLIVTDGLQVTDDEVGNISYAKDFFYLINPELCLTDRLGR